MYYYPSIIPDSLLNQLENEYSDGNPNWTGISSNANSRKVIHYGQVYTYATHNKTDLNNELIAQPFTELIKQLLELVYEKHPNLRGKLVQGIVNRYLPGEGISAHIVDIIRFDDYIVCFTIGSGAVMEFTKDEEKLPVQVVRGSCYIMSGPSRYEWKHALIARKTDLVDDVRVARGRRVSLTFRQLKNGY